MCKGFKIVWLLGALLALTGCSGLPFMETAERNYQRGWVSMEQDQYFVRGCRERTARELSEPPRQLDRLFKQRGVTTPLYVEWIGEPSPAGQPVDIAQLRYVSTDPAACQSLLNDRLMLIQGKDDDWRISITETHIRVFLSQQRRTLLFPVGSVMRQGSDWWWESEIEGRKQDHRLSLRVRPVACQNEQAWHGLTAVMTLNGREYNGCAKRGNLARLDLFAEYRLPAEVTTRDVRLTLNPNGVARLSEDYLNQQPALVSRGDWQLLSNGRLLVTLDDPDPKLKQEALMFVLTEKGLRMPRFHPRYGQRGLTLEPSGLPMAWAAGRLVVP